MGEGVWDLACKSFLHTGRTRPQLHRMGVIEMATQNESTWTDPTGHTWTLPSIQTKLSFCKSKKHKAIVDFVMDRARHKCKTCGDTYPLHIDHIIPRRAGGTHHPDNLQVLCASCHARKTMTTDRDLWPYSIFPTDGYKKLIWRESNRLVIGNAS